MIVLITVMLFSCTATDHKPEDFEIDRSYATEEAFDIEVNFSDSAQQKIRMTALLVERYANAEKPYTEYPKGINVWFFNENGEVSSTITSNFAIQYDETKITEARNDVIVINEKGETLNTEHLIWDEKKAIIYTEEFVRITTENESITGYGFEADQEFNSYSIRNIQGTINLRDDEDSLKSR